MFKWNSCCHFWATTQKCLNKEPPETPESMKIVQDISETIDWSPPRVQTITLRLHCTNIPLWHCLCMKERWSPQTEKLLDAGQWQDPPEDVRHSSQSWSPLVQSDTFTPASCWRSFCSGSAQHVPLCTKEHLLVPPMGYSPVQVSWNELLLFAAVDLFWRSQTLIFKVVLSNTSAAFWKSSGFFFGLCDFSSLVLIPEDL